MKKRWHQIGQHDTCPIKHKSKSKNQNMLYQQTQHSDLIGFQIPFQSDLKNLFLHPKIMKKDLTTTNVSQSKHGSFGQFLWINTNRFKFWVPSKHLKNLVKISTIEINCPTLIWLPTKSKIWQAKYPMIGNCASCVFDHFYGFSQNFVTNYNFWKHANSCCTYCQR